MIRLVTQFDKPTARATAATPSCGCGCCCCCCCCLATLIGASAYTAISAQAALHRAKAEHPERVRWSSPWPGIVGALALPLTLLVTALLWWTIVLPLAAWFVLVALAYRGAGARRPWLGAAAVVVLGTVAFWVELFVGGYMVLSGPGLAWAYLVSALVLGALAGCFSYARLLRR